MNYEEFKAFVDSQKWTKAKTAKRNPHEYLVRDRMQGDDKRKFVEALVFIRMNGFLINFWKQGYILYYLEGHFYWSVCADISKETILNRNNAEDYYLRIDSKFAT